ncbi:hypothetical protein EMMF5_001860 [Cystobasidiomycetes sp. EMM_F5]
MAAADVSGMKGAPEMKFEHISAPGFDNPSIKPMEAAKACHQWVVKFQAALDKKDADALANLFVDNGWWRDMLTIDAVDFNSYRKSQIKEGLAKHGFPEIRNLKVIRAADASIVPVDDEMTWAQAYLTYETPKTRGKGLLRLQQEDGKFTRAFTFFTTLWEVKGHEEFAYERRPTGAEIHEEGGHSKNWLELRKEKVKFEKNDPAVLIVGAGQNGLMLAARLTALGIPTLVVERNPNIGDNWANRYHNLVLHDPVYADHFPYLPYPAHWPIFTPKDKLASWFKHYAEAMELNVWTSSTIQGGATYDEKSQTWTTTVVREGHQPREMKVKHLVLATGFSGEARMPKFEGMETFKGPMPHSSKHKGAEGWEGKKAIVVGCCNSGHDIAAQFYEYGADTTIVQRSSTYVVSSKHGLPAWLNGFYQEGGPPIDDADILFTSLPTELVAEFHKISTAKVEQLDKDILDGLEKAGFKLNRYNSGLFMKLIADGKIKVKQGQEIKRITENGIEFADGDFREADIIVLATGYGSMRDTVRKVVGPEVADKVGTCWSFDKQGEIHTVWRNSGVPGFWLQCGNFFQARCYSRLVALQIQQQLLGMTDKNAPYPKDKENKDIRF